MWTRVMSLLVLAIVCIVGCAQKEMPAYKRIDNMTKCQKDELIQQVRISDTIFIGNVVSIDTGWAPPSGVMVSTKQIKFQIKRVVRGTINKNQIAVSYAFITPEEGLLQNEKLDRFKLDNRYYRRDRDFIIGCSFNLTSSFNMDPKYPILIFAIDYSSNAASFSQLEVAARN